jgi:ubiquinone/menaquinone biosynthesis C-methylase UbiE
MKKERPRYDPDAYQQGRALPPTTVTQWMTQIGGYLPTTPDRILDVGCGTGRFSLPLGKAFPSAQVIGVEPSIAMLNVAKRDNTQPQVAYINAVGEALPLVDSVCDVIFMSMVLHHLSDPHIAASEARRVSKQAGLLFVRTAFRDRLGDIPLYEYFPGARAIDSQRLPSLEGTVALFSQASFTLRATDTLEQLLAPDLAAYADRIALRTISTLQDLPEEEFSHGMRRLRATAGAGAQPVIQPCDLLVLQAR